MTPTSEGFCNDPLSGSNFAFVRSRGSIVFTQQKQELVVLGTSMIQQTALYSEFSGLV